MFQKLMQGDIGNSEYYENAILTKNGEEKIIQWYNTLLKNTDGNIIRILSSGMDITKQIKAEETLRNSEQLLNDTQKLSKVGGWELDVFSGKVKWTKETYLIHEVPFDYEMDSEIRNQILSGRSRIQNPGGFPKIA